VFSIQLCGKGLYVDAPAKSPTAGIPNKCAKSQQGKENQEITN